MICEYTKYYLEKSFVYLYLINQYTDSKTSRKETYKLCKMLVKADFEVMYNLLNGFGMEHLLHYANGFIQKPQQHTNYLDLYYSCVSVYTDRTLHKWNMNSPCLGVT